MWLCQIELGMNIRGSLIVTNVAEKIKESID